LIEGFRNRAHNCSRASHVAEIEVAELDEIAEPLGCFGAKVGFGLASSVVGLWGVEANEPDVGVLVVSLECVAVDNPNIVRVDWLSVGGCDKDQRRDTN